MKIDICQWIYNFFEDLLSRDGLRVASLRTLGACAEEPPRNLRGVPRSSEGGGP